MEVRRTLDYLWTLSFNAICFSVFPVTVVISLSSVKLIGSQSFFSLLQSPSELYWMCTFEGTVSESVLNAFLFNST